MIGKKRERNKEMDKQVKRIILKEPDSVIRGLLLDLVQMEKKNEERVKILYHKY